MVMKIVDNRMCAGELGRACMQESWEENVCRRVGKKMYAGELGRACMQESWEENVCRRVGKGTSRDCIKSMGLCTL
jgi:hypothetical protein